MTLHYTFTIEAMVEDDPSVQIANGNLSPSSTKKTITVEYDYDRDVKTSDIVEYFLPYNAINYRDREMCKSIIKNIEDYLDLDALEEDEDFIEFMTESYSDDAYAACVEEHE